LDQRSTLPLRNARDVCAPNIGTYDVDAFDHRPEYGRTDLGLSGEADDEERSARTEIVNRLLVRSALYIVDIIWLP